MYPDLACHDLPCEDAFHPRCQGPFALFLNIAPIVLVVPNVRDCALLINRLYKHRAKCAKEPWGGRGGSLLPTALRQAVRRQATEVCRLFHVKS